MLQCAGAPDKVKRTLTFSHLQSTQGTQMGGCICALPQTRSCVDTGPLQKLLWLSPHSPQDPEQLPDICTEAGEQKVKKADFVFDFENWVKNYIVCTVYTENWNWSGSGSCVSNCCIFSYTSYNLQLHLIQTYSVTASFLH